MPSGDSLALALLDEVTGLALNPELYPMASADGLTYKATLALPYRAVVKYRYIRLGTSQVPEQSASGTNIRSIYFASGPAGYSLIAGWEGALLPGQAGSVPGSAIDAKTKPQSARIQAATGPLDSAGRLGFLVCRWDAQSRGVLYRRHVRDFPAGATVARAEHDWEIRAQALLVQVTFSVNAERCQGTFCE
jgi:hypothetical protein